MYECIIVGNQQSLKLEIQNCNGCSFLWSHIVLQTHFNRSIMLESLWIAFDSMSIDAGFSEWIWSHQSKHLHWNSLLCTVFCHIHSFVLSSQLHDFIYIYKFFIYIFLLKYSIIRTHWIHAHLHNQFTLFFASVAEYLLCSSFLSFLPILIIFHKSDYKSTETENVIAIVINYETIFVCRFSFQRPMKWRNFSFFFLQNSQTIKQWKRKRKRNPKHNKITLYTGILEIFSLFYSFTLWIHLIRFVSIFLFGFFLFFLVCVKICRLRPSSSSKRIYGF